MGNANHRHTAPSQFLHQFQYLAHHLGVQGRGRFIEEQHVGVHGQRPHNGNTLFLAAGEHVGIGVGLIGQTDTLQQLHGFGVGFLLLHQPQANGSQCNILLHRQMGEKVEVLEHHAHLLAHTVDVFIVDFLAVEDDLTAVGFLQAVEAAQEGGLAAAGRSHQYDAIALVDGQVHAAQHLQAAEMLLQIFNVDHFAPFSFPVFPAAR